MEALPRQQANYVPLSPLSFLARTAAAWPGRTALVHGDLRQTWAETYTRCRRLASTLVALGIRPGDTVAVLAPNTPAMVEAHFGVPMAGAVLNAINIRLDAATVRFILGHGEAKILLVDREFGALARTALEGLDTRPVVIDINDPLAPDGDPAGTIDYETLLAQGDPAYAWSLPADEWDSIALNYTSGTTGNPKGVVYHHRGAYLNAVGSAMEAGLGQHPVYLWTLPLFHCNGWCFAWAVAAMAGTNVCLRRVEAAAVFDAIARHGVTHLSGAPIVMGMLVNMPDAKALPRAVRMTTAGAAPPAATLEGMARLNFDVTHVYGLTECYGPSAVNVWQDDWSALDPAGQAAMRARQGIPYTLQDQMIVADAATLAPVPQDGRAMGEILMRGNVVMKGYLKNQAATDAAFAGGWFHTGDLAVWHEGGYVEIKDRAKDIVISGGENISTIEVEDVLYRHPAILEAAVVARPDEIWGETPCAFVDLRPGQEATAEDVVAFCRDRLARFKVPRTVVFGPLPKTSTGKMQKFLLRDRAKEL